MHGPLARPRAASLAALLAAALLPGCAWLRDRGADLADVLTVEVGLGYGLHADAKATDYLHVGAGYAHLEKVGLRGRDVVTVRDREVGLPAMGLFTVGALREGSLARLGHLHANVPDLLAHEDPWRRADHEVAATAGVVSLRVGFSPGHLLDFLAGIVGLDPAGDDRGLPFDDPAEPGSVWLRGDLHDHCDPPDGDHAPVTPEETIAFADGAGLDFVALTGHAWRAGRRRDRDLRAYAARAATLSATTARPIVLPGFELTADGHAVLLFRDPRDIEDVAAHEGAEAILAAARALPPGRSLFVPAHPRTVRLQLPFFRDYARPWPGAARVVRPGAPGVTEESLPEIAAGLDGAFVVTVEGAPPDEPSLRALLAREVRGREDRTVVVIAAREGERLAWASRDPETGEVTYQPRRAAEPVEREIASYPFDGLEALTLLHHVAEIAVGRTGAKLAKDDVFRVLDRRIAVERRRYVATGGSDNHRDLILPTTWVLARERTRKAVFDALAAGRIAIGGDEACSFEARTDLEPRWRPIGADLRAHRRVELRWRGTATLVIDGERIGARAGGYVHEIAPGSFHFYRLEAGPGGRSRSCWIYVNRP